MGVQRARTEADLETAARHFAKAVSILGIEAVLAVLFRGRPRTNQGDNAFIGREPPREPGKVRASPTIRGDPDLEAGFGSTSPWGDIVYSLRGSRDDRALALLHERVHQILTPRLYPLRRVRVQDRANSYVKSSLSRYLEEALAETAARLQVHGGVGSVIEGLRFPVIYGYVHRRRAGNRTGSMGGRGVLIEGGALIGIGSAAGLSFTLWFVQAPSSSVQPARRAAAQ